MSQALASGTVSQNDTTPLRLDSCCRPRFYSPGHVAAIMVKRKRVPDMNMTMSIVPELAENI